MSSFETNMNGDPAYVNRHNEEKSMPMESNSSHMGTGSVAAETTPLFEQSNLNGSTNLQRSEEINANSLGAEHNKTNAGNDCSGFNELPNSLKESSNEVPSSPKGDSAPADNSNNANGTSTASPEGVDNAKENDDTNSTVPSTEQAKHGKRSLMRCNLCSYMTFHADTLAIHKKAIHNVVEEPEAQNEFKAPPRSGYGDLKTISLRKKIQLKKGPVKAYRCHVCQYITFKHDNLVNHLNEYHGLIAGNPQDMDKRDFIEVYEYSPSAFVGETPKVLGRKIKDEPLDGDQSDEDDFVVKVKHEVQCDVSFDENEDYDPYEEDNNYYEEDEEEEPQTKKKRRRPKGDHQKPKRLTPTMPDINDIIRMEPNETGSDTVPKFQCPECDYVGVNEHNVRRHFGKMHVVKKELYECEECEYKTPKRQDYNVHVRAVHKNIRDFRCSYCPYAAAKKSQLKRHIGRIHSDMEFSGDYKFDPDDVQPDSLGTGKRKRRGSKRKRSTLPMPEEMVKSLTKSEGTEKYTCEHCGYEADERNQMKEHLKQFHTDPRELTCTECDFKAEDAKKFKIHMTTLHPNEFNSFMCHSCAYRTNKQFRLDSHIKTVHLKVKEFRCEYCDYATTGKIKLERHYGNDHPEKVDFLPIQTIVVYTNHSGQEKHQCNHCDYICNQPHVMHDHKLNVHKEISEYARCGICSYSAISKEEMSDHLGTIHADRRLFSCRKCEFSGANESELIEHAGGHPELEETDEDVKINKLSHAFIHPFLNMPVKRMYKCNLCDYAHLERHVVVRHKKSVHEKVKEQMCDHCSYRTFKITNLTRHIKAKHTGIKDFLCHLCNFRSALKWNLTVHMRSHERTEEEIAKSRCRKNTGLGVKHVKILPDHIDVVDGLLQCPQCDMSYQTRVQLHRHYKKHVYPQMADGAMSPKSEMSDSTQDSSSAAFIHPVFPSAIPGFAAQYMQYHQQQSHQ